MMRNSILSIAAIMAASVCSASGSFADGVASPPATMSNELRVKFIDQQPTDRLASKIVGTEIRNKSDVAVGSVSDLVFDAKGALRAYVVSVGGFLGMGTKYVAVDPSVIRLTTDKDGKSALSIDTDKDQLKAAPEYRYISDHKDAAADTDASKHANDSNAVKTDSDASKP